MKGFLKRIIPLSARMKIMRGLRFFSDRRAFSLPPPAALSPSKKSALISYVTAPFKQGSGSTLFTHAGVSKLMVRALHELGYTVDVIEWNNTVFIPRKDYQLFIGHAGQNFERITEKLDRSCPKIYFSTGTYWQEHNRAEKARFDALEQRRGVRLPYDRWINDSEERANEIANGIICLGNQIAKESYQKFPVVYCLNNATYQAGTKAVERNHEAGRKNFLFLSSEGNVHKGLDLLLEVFSSPDIQGVAELTVCQKLRPDFHALYRRELENTPNIHFVGHLDLQSTLFQEIAQKCSYIIHPSCAEGQPGAVLDGMRYGLIPVLTRENHIDIESCGFLIPASVSGIASEVRRLSCLSVEECRRLAVKTQEIVSVNFSEERFFDEMKNSIYSIIALASVDGKNTYDTSVKESA